MQNFPRLVLLLSLTVLAACAGRHVTVPAGSACAAGKFTVVDGFAGARRGECKILADDRVRLTILPEDDRVSNPSAWYAFKLVSTDSAAATARIELDYLTWPHRYWPKISYDGINWQSLDAAHVRVSRNEHVAKLRIPLTAEVLWVAGQELVTPQTYKQWLDDVSGTYNVARKSLGDSLAGRPIALLDSAGPAKDVVLLVGRQHPPEITGAFAFFAFWETLLAETELAIGFRDRYRVLAVPLLNPDGVTAGNWRHNLGRTDLNRDWGPFLQPETRLIESLLEELDAQDFRVRAFIDFHSTRRNLFYTQADATDPTTPLNFSSIWLKNAAARLTNYAFTDEARPTSDTANGKNYMYKRYGIPSVTYEVGDETSREAIKDAAVIFAEEFMKLLLKEDNE